MGKLRVDLDALETAIKTYETEIANIRDAKQSVSNALVALRASGWDSEAGRTWFSSLDDEWLRNIERQIRILERLKDNLRIAREEYAALKEEQDRLAVGL